MLPLIYHLLFKLLKFGVHQVLVRFLFLIYLLCRWQQQISLLWSSTCRASKQMDDRYINHIAVDSAPIHPYPDPSFPHSWTRPQRFLNSSTWSRNFPPTWTAPRGGLTSKPDFWNHGIDMEGLILIPATNTWDIIFTMLTSTRWSPCNLSCLPQG